MVHYWRASVPFFLTHMLDSRPLNRLKDWRLQWMAKSICSRLELARFFPNCLGSIEKKPSFWKLWTSCVPMTCYRHQTEVAWPMVMELQPNLCQKTSQLWHQWQAIEAPCRADKKEAHTALRHPLCLTLHFDCLHVQINEKHKFFEVDRVCEWHQQGLGTEGQQIGEKQLDGCTVLPCHPVFSLFDPQHLLWDFCWTPPPESRSGGYLVTTRMSLECWICGERKWLARRCWKRSGECKVG